MKLDIKLKTIAVGILVITACLTIISRFNSNDEDVNLKVLQSLSGLRFQIYGCYKHAYTLNVNTGKWDIIAEDIGNNGDERSIDIYDNCIYYYNPHNGYVELINISDITEAVKVFKPLGEISLFESISVQKDRVLYTCKIGLCEYSFSTKNQKILYDRDCFDFSCNCKDIFVATRNGIFNIKQQDDILAHGINVYTLSNQRIAYYDNTKNLIQILDLDSRKIVFLWSRKGLCIL